MWVNKKNLWRCFPSDGSQIRHAGDRGQWCMGKKCYIVLSKLHFDRWVGTIRTTLFLTRFTEICFSNCPLSSKASQEISKDHFKMHLRLFWKAASALACWNSAFRCPSSQAVPQRRCHGEEGSVQMYGKWLRFCTGKEERSSRWKMFRLTMPRWGISKVEGRVAWRRCHRRRPLCL